jgi:hypothetical protein
VSDFSREQVIVAIAATLEHGDQDNQPWAFYAHDHGGLKGYEWTQQQADIERANFIEAVIAYLEKLDGQAAARSVCREGMER